MKPTVRTWRVLRDRAPFAMPDDTDVLGQVMAPTREQARAVAQRLHPGCDVVVVDARAWPEPITPRRR